MPPLGTSDADNITGTSLTKATTKECIGCKRVLALEQFALATKGKGKGLPKATCMSRSVRQSEWAKEKYREKWDTEKENTTNEPTNESAAAGLGVVALEDFLALLSRPYYQVNLGYDELPLALWNKILQKYPNPTFTRKAIYQIWSKIGSQQWKRDEDEMVSAKMLLE
ncbi:hypothetical protein SERLA73DRAFT_151831 [Serpula lacrymans var. lacrymans S7.3]|uniref:Uncharacterized protein n=2 Tax=Serpula lacrymans var. lacrymans TaxID=341189 RepID=F8PT11_SERL3|nr:uncharacterized protein SERLADRAFT_407595 [Serpula lacrymans var. lacrymans S7.9]EGO01386.1 hypothetical protein SERLA73DRAFT_151831 [Serpula lacrymans var. lacrymans S7.3]EGO27017.1 hypothetical protein SERLADRAFT_407595 [Serpula lacrymans var. lacrymans S7.9]